ncbi:FHA domain-containing protein [Lacrimispora sp. NSJ-141]|uniref:FHA domain-containing protein n=1 Tax=Lientehia hominis TaxID=2897778 RepID=A0AAP2RK97_9FIRM|nr:FHA domain-containing protein [Lientehia hominis]MCD2493024.1 FHA domain-containing protein [Lientehia hominis]
MEMKRCPNGHFYDPALYTECPYCQGASANANVNGTSAQPNVGATMPVRQEEGGGYKIPPRQEAQPEEGQKTVAVIQQKTGINPVVGWLVCVDGTEKGKDYHLHSGNNFIGRSSKMDVCLPHDEAVSRENQGIVSYDDRHKAFYAAPGTGQNIIYLNGEPLLMIHELKAFDRLEVGNTTLMFMPLCGEEFQWEKK